MKTKLVVLVLGVVLLIAPGSRADEVAPALERADLRVRADLLLRALVAAKPEPKLRGLYAAFDSSASDPMTMAACDDDGDYVIVVSDAMLRLAFSIALLATDDEAHNTHKVEAYADHLVKNQGSGRRLLPPAAGGYAQGTEATALPRWSEIVLFLYARELEHLRAGDLVCSNPTPTTERGDDAWTPAEAAAAAATARSLYPGAQRERDESAIAQIHALRQDETGALVLLSFFERFESASAASPAKTVPTYLLLHPRSAWRAAGVKSAALQHPKPAPLSP